MSFLKVIAKLIQAEFEGHTTFSVADNTAVGDNPIRVLHLDAVPAGDNVLISLSWEGGDKVFEKQLSSEEAQHQFDLISTDLAEAVSLTQKGEYDAAKAVMTQLTQKYAENTGEIVDTNLPTLNHTQASKEFDGLWKQAKVSLRNIFPSGTVQQLDFDTQEELSAYQEKMKGSAQDHIPLWDKAKGQKPEGDNAENSDLLAPGNMSYEDAEKQKEKEHKNIDKQIKDQVKTEVESAMIEKAATVFGPDQVELVKVLKKNGRNWDEIKKILTKDFNFDKDATVIFVDEQRQAAEGIAPEEDKEKEELNPMAPPKDLVPDSAHDELLQDIEDKKEPIKPEGPAKEKSLPLKDIMDIPEEEKESALKCPKCNEDIWDVAGGGMTGAKLNKCWNCGTAFDSPEMEEIARADNSEIRKAAMWKDNLQNVYGGDFEQFRVYDAMYNLSERLNFSSPEEAWEANPVVQGSTNPSDYKVASLKKKALNPLQVPPAPPADAAPEADAEVPTDATPAMPAPVSDAHPAPQKGDRVFVSSELGDENLGYEAKFISDYVATGTKYSVVQKDDGTQENVESHRLSTIAPTEKMPEPALAPEIESAASEPDIAVTPKQNDLYSSIDEIKAEVIKLEAKLNDLESARENSSEKCKCGHIRFDHYIPNNVQDSSPHECDGSAECDCKYFKKASLEVVAAPGDAPAAEAPKPPATTLKDVKIMPDRVDKEKAIPATPEQTQVIQKLQAIEANLGQLELAREEVKARLSAELKKIDDQGERAALEAEYKGQIEKLGVLIEAVDSKLVKYNGMFLSFEQQEKTIEVKPNYKDLMDRVYQKFEGVEKYVQQVMNGMQSLAKDVTTRTLTRWPEKRSELGKQASIGDDLAQMNMEMMEALKLLSEPIA